MQRKLLLTATALAAFVCMPASAAVLGFSAGLSTAGTAAEIIAAPTNATDDSVTNTGMQAFDKVQNYVLTADITTDQGVITQGTRVDSHMIFLNGSNPRLGHAVDWTFSGMSLGTMSDGLGTLEAASTGQLGAAGTNYTTPTGGGDQTAPFNARGLEGNDSLSFVAGSNVLSADFVVTQPGDWVRVVTASVPIPASLPLGLAAFAGLGLMARRRKSA